MKDQKALLHKCLQNDVPAIVISGNDRLAIPVLLHYLHEAEKNNCNQEFIDDFRDVIQDFTIYQEMERNLVKLPD